MSERIDLKAIKGQLRKRKMGRVQVAKLPDGSAVDVPIALFCGQKEKPRLWLQAGIHGDELDAIGAAIKVLNSLDEGNLLGTVAVLPVVNTLAFRSRSRVAPIDYKDMNRLWDTRVENVGYTSAYSEIVVQGILEELHGFEPDYVIDLHGGGASALVPYVEYACGGGGADRKAEEMAKATRMRVIWRNKEIRFKGALSYLMASEGVPAVVIEGGGRAGIDDRESTTVAEAILNCMSYLSMIPSREGKEPIDQIFVEKGNWVRAKSPGLWHQLCEPGSIVTKGQVLARISDVFGKTLETTMAPVDGILIGIRKSGIVQVGDYGVNVGEIAR